MFQTELIMPEYFVITETIDGIDALEGVMPVFCKPVRMIPDEEVRSVHWIVEVDPPLLIDDEKPPVSYILLTPVDDEQLLKPIYDRPVEMSVITDDSLLQEDELDEAKIEKIGKIEVSDNVEYYRMAARDGDMEAQYQFGLLFEEGRGVGQAASIAKKWYRRSAEQGHRGAKDRLSAMGEEIS